MQLAGVGLVPACRTAISKGWALYAESVPGNGKRKIVLDAEGLQLGAQDSQRRRICFKYKVYERTMSSPPKDE
jgi:hypothetical protein